VGKDKSRNPENLTFKEVPEHRTKRGPGKNAAEKKNETRRTVERGKGSRSEG